MASSGLLISESLEDINALFGKEVEVPTFRSAEEARALCAKFLDDEEARLKLVSACNACIDAAHRFTHRFQSISEITGVSLLAQGAGSLREMGVLKNNQSVAFAIDQITSKLNSSRTNAGTKFKLQAFHSDKRGVFTGEGLVTSETKAYVDQALEIGVDLKSSKRFIRVDLGDYFSMHRQPNIVVKGEGEQLRIIDFSKDLLHINQLAFNPDELVCGFDPYCVFENPFVGETIRISFSSIFAQGF